MLQNCDVIEYLSNLNKNSIDMIILDPPYFRCVKDDWDNQWFVLQDWIDWCDRWLEQIGRVAKYSCSMWLFGYPYQLTKLLPLCEKHGFTFRQQIVIDKGMQAVAGRTSDKLKMFPTATEHLYYFHYEARNHIRELLQTQRKEHGLNGSQVNALMGKATTGGGAFACMASMKKPLEHRVYPTRVDWETLSQTFNLPEYDDLVYRFELPSGLTDVWTDINFYDRSVKKFHSTQKPLALIERLIKCSTKEGDLVLDPFMGSGTTAVVAEQMNRRWCGTEVSKEYFTKILERLNNL
jgi:DNA modification methylase